MWAIIIELLLNILLFRKGKTPTVVVVVIAIVVFGLAIISVVNNSVLGA